MGQLPFLLTIIILLSSMAVSISNALCSKTSWDPSINHSCMDYRGAILEIYKDVMANGLSRMLCCISDGPETDIQKRRALSCTMSPCSSDPSEIHCQTRHINGLSHPYDEILRERCTIEYNESGRGYTSLCCPKNSKEGKLTAILSAEHNEFPHMAKLRLPAECGGTIYNKRFIITAAHCVVSSITHVPYPAEFMKVIIGTNSAENEDQRYVYGVIQVIPHEQHSRLQKNFKETEDLMLYDIALLKLDRDIEFGPHVKAIEIAPKDFLTLDYANHAVITGWGTTDTLDVSVHLQKANFLLRTEQDCFGYDPKKEKHGPLMLYEKYQDQLLCVGGILNGKWSPVVGAGDSGGPAVCRGFDGRALLCGVTSFGGNDEKCFKNQDEDSCTPSIHSKISFFHDWIRKHAGKQDSSTLHKPYLYGQPVSKGTYVHQVHITSVTGKPCGGTLIKSDVVITAASCIANVDGSLHSKLQVHYGINDLTVLESDTQTFEVTNVKILEGFEMDGYPVDVKNQGMRVLITDNFYFNNLAVVKLSGKAAISDEELAELPSDGDTFEEGKELAFPRNMHHGGKLLLRDYHILDNEECRKRMKRVAMGEGDINVSGDILCGVETYSGGSLCDRELGGGLICRGKDGGHGGKDVLCGVQIFRLCEWSLPNVFIDMSIQGKWVKGVM